MAYADIAIIGAGMAGASLAAALSAAPAPPRILLLEAEGHPGYHATGRSAAFWTESYGGPLVQPPWRVLPAEAVRHVGDAVAAVIAESGWFAASARTWSKF